jgi:TM2 domain-containing membrane protein YozV
MKRRSIVAAVLSLLVPGLGQIYAGRGGRGAGILAAAIAVGNLNLMFLLVFAAAGADPASTWAYWIPRVGHDIISLWSIVFWMWAIADAYWQAARSPLQPARGNAAQGSREDGDV